MVLKWLFLNKTHNSSSPIAELSSHRPWYVSCEAVLSRNCSATRPAKNNILYKFHQLEEQNS